MKDLKIAYMHFHLKTGGVTTVIKNQVAASIRAGCQVVVVSGRAPESDFPSKVLTVPGLDYGPGEDSSDSADEISEVVLRALKTIWSNGPDLIHVHNPTLAKNRHLQTVLKKLQASGLTILCQIHDFAEDGRPSVLFEEDYLADCHYAVLNWRDYAILHKAGLVQEGLHCLPNPVSALPFSTETVSPGESGSMVLYPVRAIRRKNIGEAILLSLFFKEARHLAITLPPNSPIDFISYNHWRVFARRHHLPVRFEVGVQADFAVLLKKSDFVLTTSINEGFGYAFLEPWLYDKSLQGRLLPDICQDFRNQGVNLDHLYTHLQVPLQWMDGDALKNRWQQAYRKACQRVDHRLNWQSWETAWQQICTDGRIDMGLLDETAQRQVIERVIADPGAKKNLENLNPFLDEFRSEHKQNKEIIKHNRQVVWEHYNHARYTDRLKCLYCEICSAPPVRQKIDKKTVQAAFLEPQRFSLLKWGVPDGV